MCGAAKFLDDHVRPRTETNEWLTCRKQRELYSIGKPVRGKPIQPEEIIRITMKLKRITTETKKTS